MPFLSQNSPKFAKFPWVFSKIHGIHSSFRPKDFLSLERKHIPQTHSVGLLIFENHFFRCDWNAVIVADANIVLLLQQTKAAVKLYTVVLCDIYTQAQIDAKIKAARLDTAWFFKIVARIPQAKPQIYNATPP